MIYHYIPTLTTSYRPVTVGYFRVVVGGMPKCFPTAQGRNLGPHLGKFVKFTTSRVGLVAVPVGCVYLPLGYYPDQSPSSRGHPFPFHSCAALLPLSQDTSTSFYPTPLVFLTQLVDRAPVPLYPALTWTGLRLTVCPEACSASVGVRAPEGGKALLRSQKMGVGGVEAIDARQARPIMTTGAMAIRSHGSDGRPNQEIRPVSHTHPDLGAYEIYSCRYRSAPASFV